MVSTYRLIVSGGLRRFTEIGATLAPRQQNIDMGLMLGDDASGPHIDNRFPDTSRSATNRLPTHLFTLGGPSSLTTDNYTGGLNVAIES